MVTILAIVVAVVLGGLLIAFSDPVVLHVWSTFFPTPGAAIAATWDAAAAAYTALVEGSIINFPHGLCRVPRRLGRRDLLPAVADLPRTPPR